MTREIEIIERADSHGEAILPHLKNKIKTPQS